MSGQIIGICVNFAVTGLLTYTVATVKSYKKKFEDEKTKKKENEVVQNMALLTLLQAQLTNIFFTYAPKKIIDDYMYRNWFNMFKVYKSLGGNDYVDELKHKMESWAIVKTDILDK